MPAGPLDLTVRLIAIGRCEAAQRAVTLTVTHQPDLRIHQMEVTQAIQRLDNTVRVAANRRTLARLYLENGLGLFSYTGKSGELPGVTGSITLWRGSQKLAVVSPTPSVITSRIYFQPGGRETLSASLNFWLPVEHLSGPLRLEMRVWLAAPPHGVLDGPHTNDVTLPQPELRDAPIMCALSACYCRTTPRPHGPTASHFFSRWPARAAVSPSPMTAMRSSCRPAARAADQPGPDLQERLVKSVVEDLDDDR